MLGSDESTSPARGLGAAPCYCAGLISPPISGAFAEPIINIHWPVLSPAIWSSVTCIDPVTGLAGLAGTVSGTVPGLPLGSFGGDRIATIAGGADNPEKSIDQSHFFVPGSNLSVPVPFCAPAF